MSFYKNNKFVVKYNTSKIKAIMYNTTKVWSSGSLVSYYDNTTLLGTEEIDEGLDVLRPLSITPTKTNYTHIGWALTNGGAKVTTLVATGEPISLYAIWLPTQYTIYTATLSDMSYSDLGGWYCKHTTTFSDSKYISGTPYAKANAHWNSIAVSTNFNLNFGEYTDYTFYTSGRRGDGFGQYAINGGEATWIYNFDPVWDDRLISNDSAQLVNGTNTISTGVTSTGDYKASIAVTISRIVLSNPTPWT